MFVCLFYWKFEEGQFEDYTEEEEQRLEERRDQ